MSTNPWRFTAYHQLPNHKNFIYMWDNYQVYCAVISNNNILNYWLSLYSKCLPFALTHARRCVHHCLTAVSIAWWCSSSQTVRIRERSLSTSLIRPSATLQLVMGIFRPKNSTVTKFCHLALGGLVIMPHRVDLTCTTHHQRVRHSSQNSAV